MSANVPASIERHRRWVLVKACLNGSRPRAEHEAVPVLPHELGAEAKRAVAAGAGALHIHPRRADGSETLDSDACAGAIQAIRAACPGVPVGLSTGIWIEGESARRLTQVARWARLPDFVSVNVSEPGTLELCELLLARRVGIEAGLWTAADAEAFVRARLAARCLRILIEPREGDAGTAIATADAIARVLNRHDIRLPRLLTAREARPGRSSRGRSSEATMSGSGLRTRWHSRTARARRTTPAWWRRRRASSSNAGTVRQRPRGA